MKPLPPELLRSLENVPGYDEESFKAVHVSGEQITSVRINPNKFIDATSHFPGAEKIPWCSTGYYLQERPSFTIDPLFHAGAYYVQEPSSMFLEEVVKQTADLSAPLRVLDLCASPGGKSTLIQSIISAESLLVSNEVIKTRVSTLANNMTKWGGANVIVTNNDAKDFQRLPAFFDVIVVDAPCSGSGLFRKDNDAIDEWSMNNVELCSQRQQRILSDILPALKTGGILIYSTCSFSAGENENISDFLAATYELKSVRLSVADFSGITETHSPGNNCFGYRFYPNKIKGEGFFIAAFRKTGEEQAPSYKRYKDIQISGGEKEIVAPYVKNAERYAFIKQHEDVLALPADILHGLYQIQSSLYIKKAGIKIGSVIRNELIPHHEFSLSYFISDKINTVNVSLETALDYLRKKEIQIAAAEKGWAVVKYKDHALGLVKILPGRVNNYYPNEMRILNK